MVQVKALRSFKLVVDVKVGDILNLTDEEYRRLNHIVEYVDNNDVNKLDQKPNTNKKGGIKK